VGGEPFRDARSRSRARDEYDGFGCGAPCRVAFQIYSGGALISSVHDSGLGSAGDVTVWGCSNPRISVVLVPLRLLLLGCTISFFVDSLLDLRTATAV
jgi:hypothetical protein